MEGLACPICLEQLCSPVLLPCCGHSFCASCLHRALSRGPSCPLCRSPATWASATPNRAVSALLPESCRAVWEPPPAPLCHALTIQPSSPALPRHAGSQPTLASHALEESSGRLDQLPRQPSSRLRSCADWMRRAEPRIRCICYVVLTLVFMVFLRVYPTAFSP